MAKRKNNAREKAICDKKILNGLKLLLSSDEYISRNDLCAVFNEPDREIRSAKKVLSYDIAIISDKTGKGYRKVNYSVKKPADIKNELNAVLGQLAFIGSYYNSLKMTMRPLIASKKVLQKLLAEAEKEQNENAKSE